MGATGSGTILVVEDHADLRELFDEILTAAGYTVVTAADGAQALRLSNDRPGTIDLVVTDVVMPNMLGTDLAGALLQDNARLKVLFVSGHAQPVVGAATPLPPRAKLLQKPFMEAELLDMVAEAMAGGAGDRVMA